MVSVIVGCPAAGRSWILQQWYDAVESARPRGLDLTYALSIPSWDTDSLDIASAWKGVHVNVTEEERLHDGRSWGNKDRYYQMADLRNGLLRFVRQAKPDYYLSLDSDILLAPKALAEMIETLELNNADAVGGFTFLDPIDRECTNLAQWHNRDAPSKFRRVTAPGQHQVDVIMAIKLMGNMAYNINYEYHDYGEDFGWAIAARRARAKIFCDGRSPSKHVMSPKWLNIIDSRVGY